MAMTSTELLDEVRKITHTNLEYLKKKFAHLSDEQKLWRPTENSWNIQEIFAHLNEYARFYHDAFNTRIARTKFRNPRELFLSSPLGRSAWNSMKLGRAHNVKRKFKSPRAFNPAVEISLISGQDIADFQAGQQELLGIFDQAQQVNIRRVKVPISISKIIRLRLGDALLYVVYHNERHMQQALNVLAHPKFPRK
jgi:uncharacterized damage-inducible protein DinB